MIHPRELCIVLKSVLYQDRHKILTALSEHHGRISAIARNSVQSRRFGGSLDLFVAAEWEYRAKEGAELWELEATDVKHTFENLRSDFGSLSAAGFVSEVMLRIAPERSPAPDLFKLLSNTLMALHEGPGDSTAQDVFHSRVLNVFMAKVLQWGGVQPQFTRCLACDRGLGDLPFEAFVRLQPSLAGWVCCGENGLPLSVESFIDYAEAISQGSRTAARALTGGIAIQRELFKGLEALLQHHVPGFDKEPIKSARFIFSESNP